MGVLDSIGVSQFFEGVDVMGFLSTSGKFIVFILLLLFVGGIVAMLLYRRNQIILYNKRLEFYEEINGRPQKLELLWAREITIPNSNIKVFHIRNPDMYLPRATKKMGKNTYWYMIRKNRELVNFSLKNMNEEMTEANLDFDHTDMRYAYENLRDLIKRNFKDKSVKWWKEYKDLISTIVFIVVMGMAMSLLIWQISKAINQVAILLERMIPLMEAQENILARLLEMEQLGGVSSGIVGA